MREDIRLYKLRKFVVEDPTETGAALWWILQGARLWWEEGWGSTTVWADAIEAERAAHDPLSRWMSEFVTETGAVTDRFDVAEAMTSFRTWLVMSGADKPKLSEAALRDELVYRIRQTSIIWDKDAKIFVGGTVE